MSTFNGLPAHVLLVHFIVVLAPLTAVLAIVCTFWPAARQRLVWLVLTLALITAVLTPLTTDAGEWLAKRKGRSPLLHAHTELGDTMAYFSIALVAAAALIAFVHLREARGNTVKPVAVAHCGRRDHREHRDDSTGLPHRGFRGQSVMEQAVGCGILYALTPTVTQFASQRGSGTTLHDTP